MKRRKKIFMLIVLISLLICIGTFSAANTTKNYDDNSKSDNITEHSSTKTMTVSDKKIEKKSSQNLIKKDLQPSSNQLNNKTEAKITLLPIKGIIGEDITLTAYLKDDKNKNITGGNLAFKLNGKTLRKDKRFDSNEEAMKLPVKNGIVTISLKADLYLRNAKNLTASYSGTNTIKETQTPLKKHKQILLKPKYKKDKQK